ncbi:MAG: hypothetical protein ABFS18_12475 [Thermodesulfobacteriota bacterium]
MNTIDKQHEIMNSVKQCTNKNISIIAGHYCVADELEDLSSYGAAEKLSFELGIHTYMQLEKTNNTPTLTLWVNDIGIPKEQRKLLKENYQLPHNYQIILEKHGFDKNILNVLFESTFRNKSSVLFRKAYKKTPDKFKVYSSNDKSLARCIDNSSCKIEKNKNAYAIDGPDSKPLVMKEGPNPKCNLILGTLFRGIDISNNANIILNIFNNIYINRIRLGIFVAHKLYDLNTEFINFFCDDDEVYNEQFDFCN